MNIETRMKKAHARRELVRVAIAALGIADAPFRLVALPHTLLTKAICRLGRRYHRLAFVQRGMCGGCGRFGRDCKRHVKNPYAQLFKDCYKA